MGAEPRFSEKWDFRRKENNFNDSSSDDPDSKSSRDPFIPDSNGTDDGTKTVTREEPVKTRKRRTKKAENKPEKAKQVRKRKPKTVCAEEKNTKKEEDTKKEENAKKEENVKKEETVMGMDGLGKFVETLIDDLKASRESLMDWMKTELCDVKSPPPSKKRGAGAVIAQKRPVKKRMTKKKKEEEEKIKKEEEEEKMKEEEEKKKESEKQSKPDEYHQEMMNKPQEKSSEIAPNGGALDCNAGPFDTYVITGQGGDYFQQQQEGQEALVTQTEMNETMKNPKSIVLAIKAPNLSKIQQKTGEANTNKNRSEMVVRTGPVTQNDQTSVTPYAPNLSSTTSFQSFLEPSSLFSNQSSSSLLQCFPLPPSLLPSPSQESTCLASNNNFQPIQPVLQIPDFSGFQTERDTGGQEFGNPLFHNNGSYSGFPPAFQPNLMAGNYNFPVQENPATYYPQSRDNNNNMFGDLRMADGAIRYSGNRFPETDVGINNNGLPDYRTSSGR